VSHGDVTPTAILALLTRYGMNAEIVERGIDYLVKTQTSSGVWESFWWTSFLYSTEASLAVRNDADFKINSPRTRKTLLSAAYKGAFEAALLLSSLMHLNPKLLEAEALRLIEELLHNQEPDGSWRNNPILRVTRRECFDPWRSGDSDTLFADTNRLFTTSTVVEALSRVYERA
jgi:squalene cyclase